MKTCYAITSGEYSDFSIHAIYTSRELAKAELPKYRAEGRDHHGIMELPLNPTIPAAPPGLNGFCCIGPDERRNGRIWACCCGAVGMPPAELIGVAKPWEGDTKQYTLHIWARDHDHAVKIAAEKFAHQQAIDADIAI